MFLICLMRWSEAADSSGRRLQSEHVHLKPQMLCSCACRLARGRRGLGGLGLADVLDEESHMVRDRENPGRCSLHVRDTNLLSWVDWSCGVDVLHQSLRIEPVVCIGPAVVVES